MSKVYLLLVDGFEEVEALATADVLIRSGVEVVLTGIVPEKSEVRGSHGFRIKTDDSFTATDSYDASQFGDADAVILPGGKAGTDNLASSRAVTEMVKTYFSQGKYVCAICAAPTVLAACGVLEGKEATCFPGFEDRLAGAVYKDLPVIVAGKVITGRSMGTAIDFGLAIAEQLVGKERAAKTGENLHRA